MGQGKKDKSDGLSFILKCYLFASTEVGGEEVLKSCPNEVLELVLDLSAVFLSLFFFFFSIKMAGWLCRDPDNC